MEKIRMTDSTLGFIGLGLIGGSIARGIKRARPDIKIMAYMRSRNRLEQAKKDGYVKTMLNRIRYIPELKSPNYNIRQFGERVALNTPIQGTAADIIKLAMVRVDNRLINEGLKSKLILQVHDELIVEAHKDEVDKVKQILSEEMQGAMELNVPLKVDMSTGHSWYDAK